MFSNAFGRLLVTGAAGAALMAALLPGVAQAGEVANRFRDQQARIDQGVRSGALTQGEYDRDEARLRRDEAARNRDLRRNDGHLTGAERARLNARLNNNSRDIYFTKHDRARQHA